MNNEIISDDLNDIDINIDDVDDELFPAANLIQLNEIVVHKTHGIGKFVGLVRVESRFDCIKIEYRDREFLYIRIDDIKSIKRYGSYRASLDKLGSNNYSKRTASATKTLEDISHGILTNRKLRLSAQGPAIIINQTMHQKVIDRFEYKPTHDQLRITEQIRLNIENRILFDRLVCGDTGSGKTEIAIRACSMVVFSGYSVMIIVPTTILCKQHFENFSKRFGDLNLKIVEASRNTNTKIIKQQIEQNHIDIIIGTHALLYGINPKNLGLIIVDEEHKFGVKQKEHLKSLGSFVNILYFSATPIPRTLQMGLSKIKSLSIINTMPSNRIPIKTKLEVYEEEKVLSAINYENQRNGKTFMVVPYISDIAKYEYLLIKHRLRYVILTGKMDSDKIQESLNKFANSSGADKIDVLLSTPIIESGINILSSNTMIVLHADKIGLSQLYQLRGRVGRNDIKGYVNIFISPDSDQEKVMARLSILNSIEYLNAGFEIANFDMQTRGFGNLLGKDQSGHIKGIGIENYKELLAACLGQPKPKYEPEIFLNIKLYIPDVYISNITTKVIYYNKIAHLFGQAPEAFMRLKLEMVQHFGPLPKIVKNIFDLVKLKTVSAMLNIIKIEDLISHYTISFNKIPNQILNNMPKNLIKIESKNMISFTKSNVTKIKNSNFKHSDPKYLNMEDEIDSVRIILEFLRSKMNTNL